MTSEEKKLRADLRVANRMIDMLVEHLDLIGWGDIYEREVSGPLRKKVDDYLEKRS